jgi:2-polyprenyl-3-methyl-5-hydroxy-6-metoxy-1,4-benzoquinol methylase
MRRGAVSMSGWAQHSSLTERSYWDETWQSVETPKLVDLSDRKLRNHGNIGFHNFFADVLCRAQVQGGALVEIGCAQSKWLPYFSKVHGLAVTGLDYSQIGCERARALLQRAKCQGQIIQADMFNPPDALRSQFDLVLSMGLVEHFNDTVSAIRACAALAKPGGIIITLIPNLSGIMGFAQRWLDRSVYDKHVPLCREALQSSHEKCGLSILRSEYLLSANLAVINHPNLRPRIINRTIRTFLVAATGGIWALERMRLPIPPSRFLSPYVACVARKSVATLTI